MGKANNSKKATVKDNGHALAVNALNEAAQIMATLHLNSGAIINQPLERAAGTLRRAALNDGTLPGSIQREMRDLANKIENANPKTVSGLRDQVVTLRMRLSHSKAVTIKATPALLLSDSALRDLKQGGAAMLKIAAAQLNQAAVAATEAQARPLFEQAARLLYQGQNSPQVIQLIKRGQIAEQGGASQMAKATRIVRKAKALGARKAGSADQVLTQLKTIQSEMTAPYWAENALNISLTANRAHQAGSRAGSDVPPRVLAQIATIEKYLREMAKMNTMEQRTATGNAILNQVRSAIAELSE